MTDDVLKSVLPTVRVEESELPNLVNTAEHYLIKHHEDLGLFMRDGKLVRIGIFQNADGKTALCFVPVVKENLIEDLTRIIGWVKFDGRKNEDKRVDCPEKVAATYLARAGRQRKMPVLRAIITAPTLRADGTVICERGYDKATRLYYDPQKVEFPAVPENPIRTVAREALDLIIGMVSEVPFVVDEDHGQINRAVFLSALLSALIRHMLPAVPLIGFSSPAAGSGKSSLVNGICYVVTGRAASPVTQGGEEETAKILSSALQAGYPVISFDNCEYPLGGSMLCQAISEPELSVRVLGKSELRLITNAAMYFATGNNLTFTGDITRRALLSMIDARCERPEMRKFNTPRPDLAMAENRVELVWAGLTVLRAFFVAGRPQQAEPVGTFEVWSRTVRDCLIWLGEPDPWHTTEMIRASDPQIENNITALNAWYDQFEDKKITSKDVIEKMQEKTPSYMGSLPKFIHTKLRDALLTITANELNSRNLGNWLRSIKDRPIGGYMVTQAGKLDGNQQWRVLPPNSSKLGGTVKPGSIFL